MKRRLRKKKHLGEFREWGCEIDIALKMGANFDKSLDDFVAAVESMGCYCGGGGSGGKLSMLVELGRDPARARTRASHLEQLLRSSLSIETMRIGGLIDLWNPTTSRESPARQS